MRICKKCGETDQSKFKDYMKRNECWECAKKYRKEYYRNYFRIEENRIKNLDRIKNSCSSKKLYINELKHDSQCSVCGESHVACLVFHHRNPRDKKFIISSFNNRTLDEIKEEIEKCDILCSNCHMKLHSE